MKLPKSCYGFILSGVSLLLTAFYSWAVYSARITDASESKWLLITPLMANFPASFLLAKMIPPLSLGFLILLPIAGAIQWFLIGVCLEHIFKKTISICLNK